MCGVCGVCVLCACVWVYFAVKQVCAVPYHVDLSVRVLIVGALMLCAEEPVETQAVSGAVWERVLALCAVGR